MYGIIYNKDVVWVGNTRMVDIYTLSVKDLRGRDMIYAGLT